MSSENEFGSESEQLDFASRIGMKVKAVPTQIPIDEAKRTLEEPPPVEEAVSSPSLTSLLDGKRPLILLGVPGAIAFTVGFLAGFYLIWQYIVYHVISLPVTMFMFMGIGVGTFLGISALILYSVNRNKPIV
jgi:hypothetical protein